MPARVAKGWTRPEVFAAPVTPISPTQLALYPYRADIELPKRNGADYFQHVVANNGITYHLKMDRIGRFTRASEWLCYKLAQYVGVPVPSCELIQTFDGDIAFGSEDIGTAVRESETFRLLGQHSLNELGQCVTGIQTPLSVIHAFDLFVNNVDRHERNFITLERSGFLNLIAIDFSRAFFWRWPFDGFMSSNDNTIETWIGLRERHGFDEHAALSVIARLGSVTPDLVDGFLAQMPPHWLEEAPQNELRAYCRDGGWAARVAALRQGLIDGSIL